MAWHWIGMVAKHVPWGEIVRRTPEILAASASLLERQKPPPEGDDHAAAEGDRLDEVRAQLLELEARDREHARVIEQMAAQLRELSVGMEVLAARIRLLAWVLVGGVIIASAALLLALG